MKNKHWIEGIQALMVPLLLSFFVAWAVVIGTTPLQMDQGGPQKVPPAPKEIPVTLIPHLSAQDPLISRDPFDLPALLKERLQARRQSLTAHVEHPVQGAQPSGAEIQPPPLRVQGLFWGGARPQAIINRQIVSAGDTVVAEGSAEVKVLDVTSDGVKISFKGREFELKGGNKR